MLYGILDRKRFLKNLKKSFSKEVLDNKKEVFKNQPKLYGKLNTIYNENEIKSLGLTIDLRDILIEEKYIKVKNIPIMNYNEINTKGCPNYKEYEILEKGDFLLNISLFKKLNFIANDYPYLVGSLLFGIIGGVVGGILLEIIINFLKIK